MKFDAVILAGGQGSRMGGRDKGLLAFSGRALVEWVIGALRAQSLAPQQIMISANRNLEQYRQWELPVLADVFPEYPGPLAGIHSALLASQADALLVVPCDMPRLPSDLLARLAAALPGQIMAVADDGANRSACCLVRKSAFERLTARLEAGQLRLGAWQQAENAVHVSFPAGSLSNMNTPQQLAVAESDSAADGLTHFNAEGQAHMVDVGMKAETRRVARASGLIRMQPSTLQLLRVGGHHKGDVLGVARIAGIMGAKQTASLIPLCHPLALTHVDLEFELDPEQSLVRCVATAETFGRTGIEMEALVAVNLALLTIYDMCKAVDRGMQIDAVCLIEKLGGKSGHWKRL